MKLELNHLASHAINGGKLRCLDDNNMWYDDSIKSINFLNETIYTKEGCSIDASDFGDFAFMVKRPLSDLTKEIQVNGNKFVPIEKINRTHPEYPIEIDENTVFFTDACELNMLEMTEIYSIFQKLLEWHFDINGLIGKGWAIDINTLSK